MSKTIISSVVSNNTKENEKAVIKTASIQCILPSVMAIDTKKSRIRKPQ